MTQKLHKFRAPTFEEALARMRTTLGAEAVVIRSSQVREGGFLGFLGKPMVELTASASAPAAVLDVSSRPRTPLEMKYSASAPVGSDERIEHTVEFYRKLLRDARARVAGQAPAPKSPARRPLTAPEAGASADARPAAQTANAPRREQAAPRPTVFRPRPVETARPAARPMADGNTAMAPAFTPLCDASPAPRGDESPLQQQVRDMREMLQVLVAETPGSGLPLELAEHYRRLTAAGLTRKAAAMLLGAAVKGSEMHVLRDERVVTERLRVELRKRVAVTNGIALESGRPRVVAVAGATGVGKTTNLAKLAAQFAVRRNAKVALVTADTYRVAAPDQLRVYANIIGLDMDVVNDPKEMAAAIARLSDRDLILIDTAGSSPFNRQQIDELRDVLDAAGPHETLLAVAANTPVENFREVFANYRSLRPSSLLFTKLDETQRYGGMYSLALEAGLPLGYLSIGQNVPDDIVLAQPAMVANLVLEGRDRRGRSSAATT